MNTSPQTATRPANSVILTIILVSYFMAPGRGWRSAPLTYAGIADVPAEDAGAASGLVNTFHQLGMALGLGILVAASAQAGTGMRSATAALTARVDTALFTGSLLLALCLTAVLTLVVPPERRYQAVAAASRFRSPEVATAQQPCT